MLHTKVLSIKYEEIHKHKHKICRFYKHKYIIIYVDTECSHPYVDIETWTVLFRGTDINEHKYIDRPHEHSYLCSIACWNAN